MEINPSLTYYKLGNKPNLMKFASLKVSRRRNEVKIVKIVKMSSFTIASYIMKSTYSFSFYASLPSFFFAS